MQTATNGAYQGASRETNHGLLLKLAGDGKTNARNCIKRLADEGILGACYSCPNSPELTS